MKIKIILLVAVLTAALNAQSIDDITEEIQDRYQDLENFSAEFVQTEKFKVTGSVNETRGKIFVKNGLKYRLQTEDRIIVTDGKTVWTYSLFNNQVLIDRMKKNEGSLLPRDLLFRYPREYYATLLDEIEKDGITQYLVKLDPKEETKGYIQTMRIWVNADNYLISKIEYTDFNNNTSIFDIDKIDIDKKLPDSLFQFTVPEGADVVDLRL